MRYHAHGRLVQFLPVLTALARSLRIVPARWAGIGRTEMVLGLLPAHAHRLPSVQFITVRQSPLRRHRLWLSTSPHSIRMVLMIDIWLWQFVDRKYNCLVSEVFNLDRCKHTVDQCRVGALAASARCRCSRSSYASTAPRLGLKRSRMQFLPQCTRTLRGVRLSPHHCSQPRLVPGKGRCKLHGSGICNQRWCHQNNFQKTGRPNLLGCFCLALVWLWSWFWL